MCNINESEIKAKQNERDAIAKQIREFRAKGGKILKAPTVKYKPRKYNGRVTESQKKK